MNNKNSAGSLIRTISVLAVSLGVLSGCSLQKKMDNASGNAKTENKTSASQTTEVSPENTVPAGEETTGVENTSSAEETTESDTTAPTETKSETPDSKPAETKAQENKQETKPESPKPTATAYISENNAFPFGDGSEFILHVDGNYSYYHYDGYYSGGGETDCSCATGDTSDGTVKLTAGSVMNNIKVAVTPYNADGTAGETINLSYKPVYASDKIGAKKVTPCTHFGEIYSYDGSAVVGLASSYLVNGGAYACERTDLMNGWHVNIVNYYSGDGHIYFEVYDSDDGDYYGWVDSSNIMLY